MQLTDLQEMFPKTRNNKAVTGNIPIDFYNKNKDEINVVMKANKLKVYYRGAREQNHAGSQSMVTNKDNAESVVLYPYRYMYVPVAIRNKVETKRYGLIDRILGYIVSI